VKTACFHDDDSYGRVRTLTRDLKLTLEKHEGRKPAPCSRGGGALTFRFAEYEIDVARHELCRRGKLVPIEPQVFDLLVHLVRNRNRTVNKSELVEFVWKGRIVSEATLSSRVSAARQAIGDNGADQVFIRTYYKRGFRFVGDVYETIAPLGLPAGNPMRSVACTGDTLAAPAPVDRSSVAILPFQNMSGDPRQDCLADGLSEDIITGLSRQQWFSVIDRNTSFAFKGEGIDVRKLARELGVRYVLEGSLRRAADRVRISAQLIDATRCIHVWANRHDTMFVNGFDRQDDITSRIVDSVKSQIILAEAARLRRKPLQNIEASDLVMQALPHIWRMSASEQRLAQDLLRQALMLDDKYAHAYALVGWTYVNLFNLDSPAPIGEVTEKAFDAAAKALILDDRDPWAHLVLGLSHARRRRCEMAIRHLSKCIELNPNFALGYAGLGYAFACCGKPECGLESLEHARRLSPLDPFLAAYEPVVRYMALFALERYEETTTVCRSMAVQHPNHAGTRRLMTVSLGLLGKIDEARESLTQTLTLQPDLSSDHVANNTVYANPSDRSRFLLGLQKAGLKH
jgi:TolB-like protein